MPDSRTATLSGPSRRPVQRSCDGLRGGRNNTTSPPVSPPASSRSDRMGSEATARRVMRQLDATSAGHTNYAMTPTAASTTADAERLAARVVELERERKHLLAVIEILKEVSTSLHFIDILQAIARKL